MSANEDANDVSEQNRRSRRSLAGIVAVCCIPFILAFNQRDRTIEIDEIYWIGQAYYFHLAFEKRDWSHSDWQLVPAHQNPVVGKYVIGSGLRMNGLSVTDTDWLGVYFYITRKAWGEGSDREGRRELVERMRPEARERLITNEEFEFPPEYLLVARTVMLFFGVTAVALVFFLGSTYMKPGAALCVAAVFALHPAVGEAYTNVGVDILACVFSLAAVIHYRMIETRSWTRLPNSSVWIPLIVLSGALCLACAVGSKLNAALVGFVGVWFSCATFLRSRTQLTDDGAKPALMTALMLAMSAIVFVLVNPVTLNDPISGLRNAIQVPQTDLALQKQVLPDPLTNFGAKLVAVAGLSAAHPLLFLFVIAAFAFHVRDRLLTKQPWTIVAVWWLITLIGILMWIPFARHRYLVPLIPPSLILLGIAGQHVADLLRQKQLPEN